MAMQLTNRHHLDLGHVQAKYFQSNLDRHHQVDLVAVADWKAVEFQQDQGHLDSDQVMERESEPNSNPKDQSHPPDYC
jgi:hypothetical protein